MLFNNRSRQGALCRHACRHTGLTLAVRGSLAAWKSASLPTTLESAAAATTTTINNKTIKYQQQSATTAAAASTRRTSSFAGTRLGDHVAHAVASLGADQVHGMHVEALPLRLRPHPSLRAHPARQPATNHPHKSARQPANNTPNTHTHTHTCQPARQQACINECEWVHECERQLCVTWTRSALAPSGRRSNLLATRTTGALAHHTTPHQRSDQHTQAGWRG